NKLFILLSLVLLAVADVYVPIPTENQIRWHKREIVAFYHFGVNTYTGAEWGTGGEDPNIFQPNKLNTTQWIEATKKIGATEHILVTKHHDGFFLFPNQFTNHTVASSSWRQGKGDVVKEFVKSCRELGVMPSFYLSPWDRNFYNMTWKPEYNEFYKNTLQVLLTNYGPFYSMWWDGANAQPGMTHYYEWKQWYDLIKKIQPQVLGGGCGGDSKGIYDCGPDISWGWTESGLGDETCWNSHAASVEFPEDHDVYAPLYLDVSIRPGWFYHANEQPKTLSQLVNIYFKSVGRNYQLQLNVPPTKDGLLDDRDVKVLEEFGNWIDNSFKVDEAHKAASITASSTLVGTLPENIVNDDEYIYWSPVAEDKDKYIQLDFETEVSFNAIMAQEFIRSGQRISEWYVEIVDGDHYNELAKGTTMGYKRILPLEKTVSTKSIRVHIVSTIDNKEPSVSKIALYNTISV
ncbi:hypothetical protein WA158_003757, partial [Blastocystis sp. Blastoise]